MELRSFNVERVYAESVTCRIGDNLGVKKEILESHKEDIKSMLDQLPWSNNKILVCFSHIRKDNEIWTPYMQIVDMLMLMAKRLGLVSFEGKLSDATTLITRTYEGD